MNRVVVFFRDSSKLLGSWAKVFWFLLIVVTLVKLYIAYNTFGSCDVIYWNDFLQVAKAHGGIETYKRLWYMNHPPFMLHILRLIDFLANISGTTFQFWLRVPAIMADAGTAVLILKIISLLTTVRFSRIQLFLLIFSPVSIIISGYHGNTDPVMLFFFILSVYCIMTAKPLWIAGIAFGLSLSIKVVGIMLIPCLFFYLSDTKKRILFFISAFLTVLIGSMPYVAQDWKIIYQHVLGYNGLFYGTWGIPYLLSFNSSEKLQPINAIYMAYGKYIILIILTILSWLMSYRKRVPLFVQSAIVFSAFTVLMPSFATQYTAWLVPWMVIANIGSAVSFWAVNGFVLFTIYNHQTGGIPWYFSDCSLPPPIYYNDMLLLCWGIITITTITLLRTALIHKKQ